MLACGSDAATPSNTGDGGSSSDDTGANLPDPGASGGSTQGRASDDTSTGEPEPEPDPDTSATSSATTSTGSGDDETGDESSTGLPPAAAFSCAWQPMLAMSNSNTTTFLAGLASDAAGNPTLLYAESGGGSYASYGRRLEAGVWSPAVSLWPAEKDGDFPRLAIGTMGDGVVGYHHAGGAFARVFQPPGWGEAVPVLAPITTNGFGIGLDFAVDAFGNAVAVWKDGVPQSETAVNVARLPAGDDQWSAPTKLNVEYIVQASPRLAVAGADSMFIAWDEAAELTVRSYDSSSGEVGELVTISPGVDPVLGADLDGNAMVIRRSSGTLYATRHDGVTGSWGEPEVISDGGMEAWGPTRISMASGEALVAWSGSPVDGATNANVVRYDPSAGGWQDPEVLADPGNVGLVSTALNNHGHAIVAWGEGQDLLRTACRDPKEGWSVVDVDTDGLSVRTPAIVLDDEDRAILALSNLASLEQPTADVWVIHSQ